MSHVYSRRSLTCLTILQQYFLPFLCPFGNYGNAKQSVIVWEWDLHNVESDEESRPEFETNATNYRMNPVTREKEPYMSTWTRAIRFVITGSAVLFMIFIVLSAVLGTIIYRISVVTIIYGGGGFFVKEHAKLFTTVTAALINLVVIMILTR
ncbi:hypothetical protein DOY81_013542, partial [Sarcophaga bullata]